MRISEETNLVMALISIKNKEYLSWDMISKETGLTRYTLYRLITTNLPIRLMTLRKLKAFVERYNASQDTINK